MKNVYDFQKTHEAMAKLSDGEFKQEIINLIVSRRNDVRSKFTYRDIEDLVFNLENL